MYQCSGTLHQYLAFFSVDKFIAIYEEVKVQLKQSFTRLNDLFFFHVNRKYQKIQHFYDSTMLNLKYQNLMSKKCRIIQVYCILNKNINSYN